MLVGFKFCDGKLLTTVFDFALRRETIGEVGGGGVGVSLRGMM